MNTNEHSPAPWTWIASGHEDDYKTTDALEREDLDPWLASGSVVLGELPHQPGSDQPAMVLDYAGCGSHDCESRIADRRLIAAAPDLLKALEAVEWVRHDHGRACPSCNMEDGNDHEGDCRLAAAISAARGEVTP